MIRLLSPFMLLAYLVGGILAGPVIGWQMFQSDRKEWAWRSKK